MKKNKNKIIAGAIIAIIFTFFILLGGEAPGLRGFTPEPKETASVVQNNQPAKEEITEAEKAISDIPIKEENKPQKQDGTPMTPAEKIAMAEITPSSAKIKQSNEEYSEQQVMGINGGMGKDQYRTNPVPDGKLAPIEPENAVITDKELTCTLSVRCDAILQNIGWLNSEKVDIVPKDGVVFAEKSVTFYEGESVFNLLTREMKRNKIHLEFENIPIYNSAYIEGIANLYQFDCGELSGWIYKVNDWFPNYGCSRYQLKAGDKIEWIYTCDLGSDVSGNYFGNNGN